MSQSNVACGAGRMNIGIAVHNYDSGEGTGGYTTELVPRISREHDVTLYAARVRSPVPLGVRLVRVPAIMVTAYTAILSFPAALATVRRHHDVLHAQGWVTTSADVATVHSVLAAWRELARKHGVSSRLGERLFGGFVTQREAALYRGHTRAVIAPSRRAREDLDRHYARREGVYLIPHGFRRRAAGVDGGAARRAFGVPADRVVALWMGDARKGLETAIDAIAGAPGAHLLVATHSAPARFLARASSAGCRDRVHWAAYQTKPWNAFAAADVFLYPTIYDTFGLVVAEAMDAGLVPIVTRTAGVAELLEHGTSAWLLHEPSPEAATAALRALVADPELRARLSAGARVVASRRPWDNVARETLAVYETVAAER